MKFLLPTLVASQCFLSAFAAPPSSPVFIWVEGESATLSEVERHPWWYDKVKSTALSGGDFISHWNADQVGKVTYTFDAPESGNFTLWVRANPTQAVLQVSINRAAMQDIPLDAAIDPVNIAADGKTDLRHLAWANAGEVSLKQGPNTAAFQFTSSNNHHGMLDAFTFVKTEFQPSGIAKPDEVEKIRAQQAAADSDWIAWNPRKDPHKSSAIDLRRLNEKFAGEHGQIAVKDGRFIRSKDGKSVRFWAINGPQASLRGEALQHALRDLAKHGVNLIRIHSAVFNKKTGAFDPDIADRLQEVVARAKKVGIYTHLSIYFPLWFEPESNLKILTGYDGKSRPYAALFFNKTFEQQYQTWWKNLLTQSSDYGAALINEPALFGVELINEDSFFFWTFAEKNIPDSQWKILEGQFADWATERYGSLDKTYRAWDRVAVKRDALAQNRLGFRPLWNIFNERTQRDMDTTEFLVTTQRAFYQRQVDFLDQLNFKGLITASNWHTANDRIFKPLEIYSYLPGDYIDRHGYFSVDAQGEHVAWSIRPGHVYAERSALRFDPVKPGEAKNFAHPIADPKYNGLPSMISETTWCRPNRHRTEAPLFFAAYGALQDSNCIVHFAHDGAQWAVKPRFWMQPWTLMSPSQIGQFPATALIYRLGLLDVAKVMAKVDLNFKSLLKLEGTPLVQEGNLDELRKAQVVTGTGKVKAGDTIDPRIHFVGRTEVTISDQPAHARVEPLDQYIDDKKQIIRSQTGQIELNYAVGVLKISAPKAQALSGDLAAAGATDLGVLTVDSALEIGHIILVPLDELPLDESKSMLLQVMTEEKNSGWKTEPVGKNHYKILDIGRDPWLMRRPSGTVGIDRPDARKLKVTALDSNGYPLKELANAEKIELQAQTAYYLIEKR